MRVVLVHWDRAGLIELASELEAVRLEVAAFCDAEKDCRRALLDETPDGLVIDLSQLPRDGLDFAAWARAQTGLAELPLIFLGGDEADRATALERYPDATVGPVEEAARVVRERLHAPEPEGEASLPLWRRLGLVGGGTLMLLDAPASLDDHLKELPDGVFLRREYRDDHADAVLLFARGLTGLEARVRVVVQALRNSGSLFWIARPIGAEAPPELTPEAIDAIGHHAGLHDVERLAIDGWVAHGFSRQVQLG